jgi:SAM-dependent methyltransferase
VFLTVADFRNPNSLASRLRRKRFAYFAALLAGLPRPVRILDVGGTLDYWRDSEMLADGGVVVTLINSFFADEGSGEVEQIRGDACALSFEDGAFDVVYSNSVIEHVGGPRERRRMADEIQRVGKRFFVQTPNYYFPIEPHFLFPGFQFLPASLRARLLTVSDLGWATRQRNPQRAREFVDGISLLRRSELETLFPGAKIYAERFFGLSKSFIAHRGF